MISDVRIEQIIREETERYITEKKKKAPQKKSTEDSSHAISKRDQMSIKNKVTTDDGKHIVNVSAIAREAGISQSLANRYINGGVHNGKQGWVKYDMPKKVARKLLAAMAREKV
jgi:hypothetical protein